MEEAICAKRFCLSVFAYFLVVSFSVFMYKALATNEQRFGLLWRILKVVVILGFELQNDLEL